MTNPFETPLFGVTITIVFYVLALALNKRLPKLHPLFLTAGGIIVLLLAARIPYSSYQPGGDMISFMLGPATVALAVPLYKNFGIIRRAMLPVLSGITAGALSAMISAAATAYAFSAPHRVWVTLLPKSVTTAIALEIAKHLGGIPALAAIATTLSGLIGSMFGPEFLRLCGINSDLAIGAAVGTAAHGIGTGRLVRENELQGSVSGFAMAAAGIITSILLIPVYHLLF